MKSILARIAAVAFLVAFGLSHAGAGETDAVCDATRTLKVCDQKDPDLTKSVCACDLTKLRPLQTAVGMSEVKSKMREIEKKPAEECEDLKGDPIKVILGPGGALFITDHHHTAYAWLLVEQERRESPSNGVCKIVNGDKGLPLTFQSENSFWAALEEKRLIRRPPGSLASLGNDPYRSLAWLVRKRGGFCKTKTEFAEFAWADFFKERLGVAIADGDADQFAAHPCDPVVTKAVELAHSPAAEQEGLPGYSAAACKEDKDCTK